MKDKPSLSHHWRRWVAENVLLGVAAEQIESQAVAAGIEREVVCAEIEHTKTDPYIEAGRWVAQRLRKLESMQQARIDVARQNAAPDAVDCRCELPANEFRERFYAQNRPVKLLNML